MAKVIVIAMPPLRSAVPGIALASALRDQLKATMLFTNYP